MIFSIFIHFTIAIDCFQLNSECIYNAQRSSVQFLAAPSKTLVGDQKKLCENVINGQTYELQVHLGNVIFSQRGLIYNKDHTINLEVSCSGNISNCAYQKVKTVQTATYQLTFHEIDLTLNSIINVYEINDYNHLSCIRKVDLLYDGVNKNMEIDVIDPVIQCPSNMIAIPSGKNFTNNVFMTTRIGSTQLAAHGYNDSNQYGNVIKFDNGSNTNDSTKPSDLKNFWQEIRKLGPYNEQNLHGISILLTFIRNNPVLEFAMRLSLLTEIKQNRDNQGKGKDSFYYNQSIEYSISSLTNKNQADCFTGVDIELHKTFFYINTAQNLNSKTCDRQHIESNAGKSYDSIKLQIIASQNLDKSGFNYHVEHELADFELGQDINQRFSCKNDSDCSKLLEIQQIHRKFYNTSVSMKLLFMHNESIIFAIQYTSKFSITSYNQTNISVLGERICMEVSPVSAGSQQVDFTLLTHQFDLSQYMATNQNIYCSTLSSNDKKSVFKIISKMKGNIDIKPHIDLKVGSKIVGDVEVVVYQTPKGNGLVWVVSILFVLAAMGGGVGIGLGFKKQSHVWETGHTLMAQSD